MSRPLVSVVLATYQRARLLARSLVCYERQEFDNDRFELVVIDDHSTDDTRDLVLDWSRKTGIRTVLLTACPKEVGWRDCGAVLNYGIRASQGEHVLLTHPEVMPGRRSVARCVEQLEAFEDERMDSTKSMYGWPRPLGLYACCKVYYLWPHEQEQIDRCEWPSKGPIAVRDIPQFYEKDVGGLPDYTHRATDMIATPGARIPSWESWVFGGCSRETWERLGGMLETDQWGSVDVAFVHRRRSLGIPNHTCPEDDTIVVHQNHNMPGDVITDRDEAKWKDELKGFDFSVQKMMYPAVDNL